MWCSQQIYLSSVLPPLLIPHTASKVQESPDTSLCSPGIEYRQQVGGGQADTWP